jgi:glucosyl-3-phosphoglycerate synthase
MLIDISARFGPGSIGQVDLGVRKHRHRSLQALAVQAAEVAATVMMRTPDSKFLEGGGPTLQRADGSVVPLNIVQRPPIAEIGDTTP